ncbi:MAG: hypothetical protein ACD_24C00485G0007 [uncultured bacterium]|uniref:Uncharacterized protein n=1 Tax=candidate division WWE3 bacterium RBG_16_37_10 TaxID=1802610 RepID=A0A1F4V1D6_UNCKA|nr:MAG: hypothetical protein ACD_24C00485G0007 [uncultured bacterium]OGC50978.1 MAG: hypothetical protein A2W32_04125 [candidate division WWE3 bacterium RBG_16_37_10]HBH18562.1 hypothetical protein [Cyanobacteria bacterium UBA9579]
MNLWKVIVKHRLPILVTLSITLLVASYISKNIKLVPDREKSIVICDDGRKYNFYHPLLRNYSDMMLDAIARGELLMSDENASRICGDLEGRNKVTVRTEYGN